VNSNRASVDFVSEAALRSLGSQARADFPSSPQLAMEALGLTLRPVEQLASGREEGGACDGMSFLEDGVVLYAPTPESRRENFTLAHELGHWLVERDDGLLDIIADQPDPGKFLETVCDRIAQALLLPEELLVRSISGPVRALDLLTLYKLSNASYPACAIALAQRLPGLGAVVLLDVPDRLITTSSIHPDPEEGWPRVFPWPGQSIPSGHPLVVLEAGRALTGKTYWRTPWGEQQEYYVDALSTGQRLIAVFSDRDIWNAEPLHLDAPRDFDRRPELQVDCCGESQTVRGFPCDRCGTGYCTRCGRCRCQRLQQREATCQNCFTRHLPHLIVDGLCVECRS
jgi:hypothetical protein